MSFQTLTFEDIQALVVGMSGKNWLPVVEAINDNNLDGETLADCMASPQTLAAFFKDELECQIKSITAKQLHHRLCKAAEAKRIGNAVEPINNNQKGARKNIHDPHLLSKILRVQYTPPHAEGDTTRITVEVCKDATVATILRCILDHLQLPLATPLQLVHAGKLLAPDTIMEWEHISCVYAHHDSTPGAGLLTLQNLLAHPAVTTRVVTTTSVQLDPANNCGGWTLHVHDTGKANILGRGSFGVVCKGEASFLQRCVPVAVKQFYMLINPETYGLDSDREVSAWVTRDLLPELNTLLDMTHPNLVHLRCIGVQEIYGQYFPAFVAMDLCDEGTLRKWLDDKRVSKLRIISFIEDIVAAMTYLHVTKRVIHRDLKSANIFIKSGDIHHSGSPVLVLGDVGLAKTVAGTKANVSAAGTATYLAPDALGGGAQCSMASDVYSASLIAVEIATGEMVHNAQNAARIADRTTRLVSTAQKILQELLAFAQDSSLTVEATNLLLGACKFEKPENRATFRKINKLCKTDAKGRVEGGFGKFTVEAAQSKKQTAVIEAQWKEQAKRIAETETELTRKKQELERQQKVQQEEMERQRKQFEQQQLNQKRRLVEVQQTMHVKDKEGRTPLFVAASDGDVSQVNLLIRAKVDVDGLTDAGRSPISYAARNGHMDVVKSLVTAKADLNMHCKFGASLDGAAFTGQVEIARLLIRSKADVDKARMDIGVTAAYAAAQEGQAECLQLLIGAKADVNKAKNSGTTPAYIAAKKGQAECLQLLIGAKADVDKARTDFTPANIAAYKGQAECLQLLIGAKADVDKARTDNGSTPTFTASQFGKAECLQLLIGAKADVDKATTDIGVTPANIAAYKGQAECLQLLIGAKADVDKATTDDGVTAAYIAAKKGQAECLRILCGFRSKTYMHGMNSPSVDNAQQRGKLEDVVAMELTNQRQEKLSIAKSFFQNGILDAQDPMKRSFCGLNSYEKPLKRISKIVKQWHTFDIFSDITFDELAISLFAPHICVGFNAKKTQLSSKTTQCIQVQVEFAGSGKVLSHGFQLSRSEPVVRLGILLGMLLPPHPFYVAYAHRVFHGHGGRELTILDAQTKCRDVVKSGDLLVILPGVCEVDVDKAMTNDGETPTYIAAEKGEVECLQVLIGAKADVDKARTDIGATPAFIAADEGQAECLQLLIGAKADVDKARTDDGVTPVYIAAQKGQAECLQLLIGAKADVDKARTDDGGTPAYAAASQSQAECLQLLIGAKADVDKARTDTGTTPVFIAAQQSQAECLQLLIGAKADVDKARTDDGGTPANVAAYKGQAECLQLLIGAKADVDKARTDTGSTPVFTASQFGKAECLQLLIGAKADMDKARTDDGVTPAFMAAYNGEAECLQLLIGAKADVDKARTDDGVTPAFMAAQNGQAECLQLLIGAKADVDKARTDIAATPAFIVAETGQAECLQLLIGAKADVDKATTDDGVTPAFIAAAKGQAECLQLLIGAKADVDKATTDQGVTPTL